MTHDRIPGAKTFRVDPPGYVADCSQCPRALVCLGTGRKPYLIQGRWVGLYTLEYEGWNEWEKRNIDAPFFEEAYADADQEPRCPKEALRKV